MDLISRYREMMKRLLPFGMAWTRDALSTLHQLLDGLSVEFARIHERAEDLLAEMEPSGTVELLSEWESAWGLPNQCTGALSTLDERRAALLAKMIHVGQQTPGFFVRVAATLGYTIVIEENVDGNPYVWRIVSNIITAPVYARAGSARAGDPIRTWGAEMLECAMRALNPAHLDLLFAYIETAIDPALVSATIWPDGQTLALTFNQALSQGAGYSDADFSIAGSLLGSGIAVAYVSGSGTGTHIYTIDGTVRVGETVTLTFTGGSTSLVRSDGAYLEPITAMTVFNGSEETEAPPSIVSASVNAAGNQLTVVFSEAMSKGAGYQDTDINLDGSLGGPDIGLTYVSGSGTDTWVFSIATVIRLGESVDLDYNGRPDGIGDVSGNDLSTVASMTVVNGSEEDYSDIVFWDGLDGTLAGTLYESTAYDYPSLHTATMPSAGTSFLPAYSKVGAKGMYINGSTTSNIFTIPENQLPVMHGRCGLWFKPNTVDQRGRCLFEIYNSEDAGNFIYLRISSTTNPSTQLCLTIYVGGSQLKQLVDFPTLGESIQLEKWRFFELSWDLGYGYIKLFMDGSLIGTINQAASSSLYFNRLNIGRSIHSVNASYGYHDNMMISSDPNRDLNALSLLEACPKI